MAPGRPHELGARRLGAHRRPCRLPPLFADPALDLVGAVLRRAVAAHSPRSRGRTGGSTRALSAPPSAAIAGPDPAGHLAVCPAPGCPGATLARVGGERVGR